MSRWRTVRPLAAALLLAAQLLPHPPASAQPRLADSSTQAFSPRPISSRDIIEAARVTAVRMAPAGDRVAYEVSRADVASNSRTVELWSASTADREPVEAPTRLLTRTRVAGTPASFDAQFVPGATVASISIIANAPGRQGIAETSLVPRVRGRDISANPHSGEVTRTRLLLSMARLPAESAMIAHRWSPDGRRLAIIVSSPPHRPIRRVDLL